MSEVALVALAVAFAVVTGVNDGGALVTTGLAVRSLDVRGAVALLSVAVAAAPLVLGVAVARTLTERLVGFGGDAGRIALAVAIVAALAVVWVLTRWGLPTSLTLALVGALAGAGFGAGLVVGWRTLGVVLLVAAVAPLVAAGVAMLLVRAARFVPAGRLAADRMNRGHRVAFGLQSLAYGVNDGQKMLAVSAVALGLPVGAAADRIWPAVAVAVAFAIGTLVGVQRVAGTIGGGLLPMRPLRAVTTELSAATAVLGTGLAGAPVSMTQSIVGGLVGTGMVVGTRRLRWQAVARLGGAWFSTLPVAFLVAAAAAAILGRW